MRARALGMLAALPLILAAQPAASAGPEQIQPFYEVIVSFACKPKLDFEVRVEPSGEAQLPGKGKLMLADKTAAAALFAIQRAYGGEAVRRVLVKPTPNERFEFARPTPPCR